MSAGSSNFIQWDPGGANMDSDTDYNADAQRISGAINGQIFNDKTANKLFYQVTTFVTAFSGALASKGYDVSDASLAILQGVLASVLTSADIKSNLVVVSFSTNISVDPSSSNGFQVTLAGDSIINIAGGISAAPGQELTFIIKQDSGGNRSVTWGSGFVGGPSVDPTSGSTSVVTFIADSTGLLHPKTAGAISS